MCYKYIKNAERMPDLPGPVLGVDIETNGLNVREDDILIIQFSDCNNTYIYDCRILPKAYLLNIFKYLNRDKTWVFHNAKFDLKFLWHNYSFIPDKIHDTMITEAITVAGQPGRRLMPSLKDLLEIRLNMEIDKSVRESFLDVSREFTEEQLRYAAKDAEVLIPLYLEQMSDIENLELRNVLQLEMKLLPVVMKMEHRGITFAPDRLLPIINRNAELADSLERKIWDIVGYEINPRSYKQLKEAFHTIAKKNGRSDMLVHSTGKNVIKRINHPLPQTLLRYREAQKLVSTYGQKLIDKVESDGKIHATFNQASTVTGRFSSSKPNLQNIPHDPKFRVPFVASPGYMFVTADYSQIELRLAGILSGEPAILEEYQKENADMHRLTASKIFQCSPEEVDSEMRYHGKTGNFSSLYGISYKSMAVQREISEKLAKKIISGFWGGYPRLQSYANRIKRNVLRDGFAKTALGRIRWFDIPSSTDPMFRRHIARIGREGFNMVIQGFAADIMKYSMVRLDKELGNYGHIVLTVHDEVGVEVREDKADELNALITEVMEDAAETLVKRKLPMRVNSVLLDSWTK